MNRSISIDFIKFIAAILITNSHMGLLYGNYDFLATGGSIGDALFFFCSGYTLFLKPMDKVNSFFNWYKRRINRIYPSVFAVAILGCVFFGASNDIMEIILHGGNNLPGDGWFIPCIMLYYIALFFIGVYYNDRIWTLFCVVIAGTAIWFFSGVTQYDMFCDYIRWLLFFDFTLLGAKIGMQRETIRSKIDIDILMLFICLCSFYAIFLISMKIEQFACLLFFTVFPLFGIVYFLYKVGTSECVKAFYYNRYGNMIIRSVGGLTLEIYLVQNYVFTDKMNSIFPVNIIVMFLVIFVAAYLARCLARALSQTFKDEPYSIEKILSMY